MQAVYGQDSLGANSHQSPMCLARALDGVMDEGASWGMGVIHSFT